jgi:hypothetical protein
MTRSKLDFATKLASLKKDGSKPDDYMSLSVQKIMAQIESAEAEAETPDPPKTPKKKGLIKRIFEDSSDDE